MSRSRRKTKDFKRWWNLAYKDCDPKNLAWKAWKASRKTLKKRIKESDERTSTISS